MSTGNQWSNLRISCAAVFWKGGSGMMVYLSRPAKTELRYELLDDVSDAYNLMLVTPIISVLIKIAAILN